MTAEKTAFLPVTPDEAFALVTDPERLRRWQTVSARVDLRAGGEYRWTVVPGHVAAGTFTEVEPGRRLVFGWGWEGSADLPPNTSTVTVTIEPADGGCLVRLAHEGLTDEQLAGHQEGWNHFFARLERAVATGDAGPDEWAATPDPLDRLTCADATLAVCQTVLRGITDADLTKDTPCAELNVGQLIDHLLGSVAAVGALAGATVSPPSSGSVEDRVATAAQQALEAWNRRGVDGTVSVGEAQVPAEQAVGILSIELLVHAWDFATATGQELTVSDEVAGYVLELARQPIGPTEGAGGSVAQAGDLGPDADALERLIAFSGRTAA